MERRRCSQNLDFSWLEMFFYLKAKKKGNYMSYIRHILKYVDIIISI